MQKKTAKKTERFDFYILKSGRILLNQELEKRQKNNPACKDSISSLINEAILKTYRGEK